jgi:hypothetical protein
MGQSCPRVLRIAAIAEDIGRIGALDPSSQNALSLSQNGAVRASDVDRRQLAVYPNL